MTSAPMDTKLQSQFRELHLASAGFVMPNAWDEGSAVILAQAGFPAIGTTSAGVAFSLARPDYDTRWDDIAVSATEMLDRVGRIARAVTVPVNADLEDGYGENPEDVAATIVRAIDAGLAGGNIEDKHPRAPGLYDEARAVERIAAARAAIDARGASFVLTARTDAMLCTHEEVPDQLATAIRRGNAYRQAGADCVFPPGATTLNDVATLVKEIAAPLNMVTGLGQARVPPRALLDAGVQRVSLGGSIARSALGYVRRCAHELREHGTIEFAAIQIPQAELNAVFAAAYDARRRVG